MTFTIKVGDETFEVRWFAADADDPCVKIRRPGGPWLRESDDGCATREEAEGMATALIDEQLDAERA